MTPALQVSLIRNQFAVECGGVLIDPSTNEVCLLFYPDTSEWRLPIGKPDAMSADRSPSLDYHPAEHSVAGCEPYAHAAQRQLTAITGYKCSHLHPAVLAHAPANPCAYMGSHMVEPLALSIEQRTAACPAIEADDEMPLVERSRSTGPRNNQMKTSFRHASSMSALRHQSLDTDDFRRPAAHEQYVMTYYYLAWLTQSRLESDIAKNLDDRRDSHSNLRQLARLPVAEVTWFKMDTAAQVLTHASDKTALREAIARLASCAPPQPPFAYSALKSSLKGAGTASKADMTVSSSSSSVSEETAKGEISGGPLSRVLTPTRNMDLVRKAANTLGKRGGLLKPKQRSVSQTTAAAEPEKKSSEISPAAEEAVVLKKAPLPRVLSIFYKFVGGSAA
ncbi:hypothetical protein DL89DRAFT_265489 [Linderina pennispora]|uniref:Uncharacterized protein n=1 Tax=Linderina pennispora TaxID=61395 RepID=A0A1Y1WE34_9FUNG|nr:uncharacterized protein DL89DRAFT_265489 [Linderina pennispora]ORX71777.1 hypothetical protein DL89DRAFT_265489 [Linderina pennispora]